MNPAMASDLVELHNRDIRRQAARRSGGHAPAARPGGATRAGGGCDAAAGLRSRIGFALVEAGLRLLAGGGRPSTVARLRLNSRS